MWLYLDLDPKYLVYDVLVCSVIFFVFQLVMCFKARRIAVKLIPVYLFVLFSVAVLSLPFLIYDVTFEGNWAVWIFMLIYAFELALIGISVGLPWVVWAIVKAIKSIKSIKN